MLNCMYVYVHVCVSVYTYVGVFVRIIGQHQVFSLADWSSYYFWRQRVSSDTWTSSVLLEQLSTKPHGSSLIHINRTGITVVHHHALLFAWVLRIWAQVFMLTQQAPYPLEYNLSPRNISSNVWGTTPHACAWSWLLPFANRPEVLV